MSELTKVDIDTLKVGDRVGYCTYPTFGWREVFRYPIVSPKTVERITPKRTKFILNGGIELDVREAKQLVVLNEEAQRQTSIAKVFSDLRSIGYRIEDSRRHGIYLIERKLTDDELIEYHKVMKNIYDKYLGGKKC